MGESKLYPVVMVRHGESEWNANNLFCGWYDAVLSEKGKRQADDAACAMHEAGFIFDVAYSSRLSRAKHSLDIILARLKQSDIHVETSWRLNERHYGALTGFNKAQMAQEYGLEQVQTWRRSFDVPPPAMTPSHKHFSAIVNNPALGDVPQEAFPCTESLATTMERVVPYWEQVIWPRVLRGDRVLVVGHGTSLRGLVKYLDKLSSDAIMELNLPTCIPFVYELDSNMRPVTSMHFLSDEKSVKEAMSEVASIGK